jgi:hypothetical protein
MDVQLLIDLVRFFHFGGLAVGIGLGLFLDWRFVSTVARPVGPAFLDEIRTAHRFIACALVVLWTSGIYLLDARTHFDPAAFSPKLLAKIAVVTVLTANAFAIRYAVVPVLERQRGRAFAALPLGQRLALAWIGAISAGSWLSAFGLGIFAALKTWEAVPLALGLGAVYGGALAAATSLALWAPRLRASAPHRAAAGPVPGNVPAEDWAQSLPRRTQIRSALPSYFSDLEAAGFVAETIPRPPPPPPPIPLRRPDRVEAPPLAQAG